MKRHRGGLRGCYHAWRMISATASSNEMGAPLVCARLLYRPANSSTICQDITATRSNMFNHAIVHDVK